MKVNTRIHALGAIGGLAIAGAASAEGIAFIAAGHGEEDIAVAGHRHAVVEMLSDDGKSRTIEVELDDDDVRVVLDGQEIAAERIKRDGNQVLIFEDEEGKWVTLDNVLKGMDIQFGDDFSHLWFNKGMPRFAPFGDQQRVMIGISMSSPDEATRDQLGLAEGQTTLVTKVHEDLPAQRAGLQANDIIVEINGSSPAGPADISAALRDMEPGDTLRVTVLREGRTKRFTLDVDGYDPEKLHGENSFIMRFNGANLPFGDKLHKRIFISPDDTVFELPDDLDVQWQSKLENVLKNPELLGRGHRFFDTEGYEERIADYEGRIAELTDRIAELEYMLDEVLDRLDEAEGR